MHNLVADNYVEITSKNNPINKLSEHFSLAKKFAFLLWNSKRFVNHNTSLFAQKEQQGRKQTIKKQQQTNINTSLIHMNVKKLLFYNNV